MNTVQAIQTQVGAVKLLLPDVEGIPEILRKRPTALWSAEPELDDQGNQKLKPNGKPRIKKAPRNAAGYNISKNKPEQWLEYEEAVAAFDPEKFTGVGVLMQASSGLVGIDLDDVPDLIKTNPAVKDALELAKKEGIYCEKSPSGNGLRLFVSGRLPDHKGRRSGGIELYADAAFLTVTGLSVWPGEIKQAQWLVDTLLEIIGASEKPQSAQEVLPVTAYGEVDQALVSTLTAWAAEKHPRLWDGHWQEMAGAGGTHYPSQSEADMALAGYLAREAVKHQRTQEVAQATVWGAFQQSGLYRPDKARQVKNYAIPKAVASALGAMLESSNTQSQVSVPVPDTHGDVLSGRMFAALWKDKLIYVASVGKWLRWREV